MNANKQIGNSGEKTAVDYLRQNGYEIITTNFFCKGGEIDIIAQDQDTLCFVEVKKYSPRNYLPVHMAITKTKQKNIIKTARFYLMKNNLDVPCRFDAVLISDQKIELIRGAFTC